MIMPFAVLVVTNRVLKPGASLEEFELLYSKGKPASTKAFAHFFLEVVLFHYRVKSPSVSFSRLMNCRGARNDQKRWLLIRSHCRKTGKFDEHESC